MKNKKTYYLLILDKSGSMTSVADQTVEGFNEQVQMIRELKKKFPEQKIRVSLTTFNHNVSHDVFMKKPSKLKELKRFNTIIGTKPTDDGKILYDPQGMTALYDAIVLSVNKLKKEIKGEIKKDKATAVVVILTDGHENSSRHFSYSDVKKMIVKLEKTGNWTFSYLGATPDAVDIAKSLKVNAHNAIQMDKLEIRENLKELATDIEVHMRKKRENRRDGIFIRPGRMKK